MDQSQKSLRQSKNPYFFAAKLSKIINLKIVHNYLDRVFTSLMYDCKHTNKFGLLLRSLLLGRKCVQFK